MEPIQEIEVKREAILDEIRGIRSMKRGTINEQYLKVPRKGKSAPVLRGPYYVLSRRQGGKTVSVRLSSPEALAAAKADVESHKRFMALCQEYEALTEKLGELERLDQTQEEKKHRKSPLKKRRK